MKVSFEKPTKKGICPECKKKMLRGKYEWICLNCGSKVKYGKAIK